MITLSRHNKIWDQTTKVTTNQALDNAVRGRTMFKNKSPDKEEIQRHQHSEPCL
jgi:hypothetical protein